MTLHSIISHQTTQAAGPVLTSPLFIRGLAASLGSRILPVEQAINDGLYDPDQARKDGYSSLRQSDASARQMAADIAARALRHADLPGSDLGLISHTSIHDHGEGRLWQPAAYLLDKVGADGALAWSVGFGCNGLILSILQAGLMLPALGRPALVVGADRFSGTSFNRWTSDRGLAYGDAAAGVVLSPTDGFAEIVYLGVEYAPRLEALHRGGHPVTDPVTGWDVTASKAAFLSRHGSAAFFGEINDALARLNADLTRYLDDNDLSLAAVVTPFVGDSVRASTYDAVFHPLAPVHSTAFGQSVGHTGTSDQILGLAHLLDTGAVAAGDHVLLIGAGAGFSVTATVLRLHSIPRHAHLGDTQ